MRKSLWTYRSDGAERFVVALRFRTVDATHRHDQNLDFVRLLQLRRPLLHESNVAPATLRVRPAQRIILFARSYEHLRAVCEQHQRAWYIGLTVCAEVIERRLQCSEKFMSRTRNTPKTTHLQMSERPPVIGLSMNQFLIC